MSKVNIQKMTIKWLVLHWKLNQGKMGNEYSAITLVIPILGDKGPSLFIATLCPLPLLWYPSPLLSLIILWWSSFDHGFNAIKPAPSDYSFKDLAQDILEWRNIIHVAGPNIVVFWSMIIIITKCNISLYVEWNVYHNNLSVAHRI